jgi:predicted small lipoprotein YifL
MLRFTFNVRLIFILTLSLFALQGCGNKGPLQLPEAEPADQPSETPQSATKK